jgi:pimeloyl-ACP methyl ester carboxylesterase
MPTIAHKLHWQESMNGVTVDCDLEIRVHAAKSKVILLLVPGADGSVDGYEDKYVTIAESIRKKYGVAVVRMANPFITSFHWDSNLRQVLEFIEANKQDICDNDSYELRIQGHSAGASVLAMIAHEFPAIHRLLLINIAMQLQTEDIVEGLGKFKGKTTVLIGDCDPSIEEVRNIQFLNDRVIIDIEVARNTDHYFSGDSFKLFLEAADTYLFGENI